MVMYYYVKWCHVRPADSPLVHSVEKGPVHCSSEMKIRNSHRGKAMRNLRCEKTIIFRSGTETNSPRAEASLYFWRDVSFI